MRTKPLTKAELARRLGVSRTHITLLTQGKRKLSDKLADKLADLLVDLRADSSNANSRTSNPLGGTFSVFGGFDSHALPPENANRSAINPDALRRTFACLLRKAGVDTMTIQDSGRWECLEMVQRYTRSVSFLDSL